MNINSYIKAAKKEAVKSTLTDWRIGAVIVRGDKIISRGHNRFSAKMEKFVKKYNLELFSLHAEMDAIMNCDNVEDAVLFIAGIKKNGQRVYCKPCEYCMKIIGLLPFKAVYCQLLCAEVTQIVPKN